VTRMMRKIIAVVLSLVAVFAISGFAQGIPISSQISVDMVDASPGSHFGVRILMANNSLEIGALQIPLKWVSTSLTLDSVSFVGSLKTADFTGTQNQSDPTSVLITYIPAVFTVPLPTFSDAEGLIAEMFFTLAPDAAQGVIVIDSGGFVIFSDNIGQTTYLPQFAPGAVIVGAPTAVEDEVNGGLLPAEFALDQNYPNPFNPTTVLEFSLPYASSVKLEVFNVLGQEVASLAEGWYSAGVHKLEFDASNQPSGLYFYRFTYDGGSDTKKMILLK